MMKEKIAKLIVALKVTATLTVFAVTGLASTTNAYAMTNSEITATMDNYKSQLDGKYWNAGKKGKGDILFAVTDKPCKGKGGDSCSSNKYVCGNVNGRQCTGFAHAYAYNLFGSEFTSWDVAKDVMNIEPGDIIHVKGHEAIVWKVSGSEIKVAECWGSSKCKISYGYFNGSKNNKTIKNIQNNFSGLKIYKHPGSNVSDNSNKIPALSIKNIVAPSGKLTKGKNCGLRGVIFTDCGIITELNGYLIDANGNTVKTAKYTPNSTSVDIRYTINNDFVFGKLNKGNYQYIVTATANNNGKTTTTELIRSSFSIN